MPTSGSQRAMTKHIKLDEQICEMAVLGGAVLGSGGGGTLEAGLRLGQLAVELGDATLVAPGSLPSSCTNLVAVATHCTSAVQEPQYRPLFHKQAVELLIANTRAEIAGLVNCSSGAVDTAVGWGQAALLGIPLVDLVFDGSIHPLAVMGLLALWSHDDAPIAVTIVGAERGGNQKQEVFSRGVPQSLIRMLQQHSVGEVGSLALAIGPLSLHWTRQHGNPSLVSQAISIGKAMMQVGHGDGWETVNAVSRTLGGQWVALGTVTDVVSHGSGDTAFSVIYLRDQENRPLELVHWHRYVTLDTSGQRIATFPDLIVTLGAKGTPLSGAEIGKGLGVHIVVVPGKEERTPNIAVRRSATYRELERVTGKPMPS